MGKLYLGTTEIAPIILYDKPEMFGASIRTFFNEPDSNGYLQAPSRVTNVSFDGVLHITNTSLQYAFAGEKTNIQSISFPDLIDINGNHLLESLCSGNTGLTEFYMPNVVSISGDYTCDGMLLGTNVQSLVFEELVSISGTDTLRYFVKSSHIITVDFKKLSSLISSNSPFSGAFDDCRYLKDIYFRALTTNSFDDNYAFSGMFGRYSGHVFGVKVHFPSNLQTTVENLSGYPTFGGRSENVQILFDLPATE